MSWYRWLPFPLGACGALLLNIGWQAVVLGLVYGVLCVVYTLGYMWDQEDKREAEKLRRLGGWPR